MHCLFLGIAKWIVTKLWIGEGILDNAKLKIMQKRADTIKITSDLGRRPARIATGALVEIKKFGLKKIRPKFDYELRYSALISNDLQLGLYLTLPNNGWICRSIIRLNRIMVIKLKKILGVLFDLAE
jgi:hypothetical protein